MNITRYKPLFSVSVSYELEGLGVSSRGITVKTMTGSDEKMRNLKLKAQRSENTLTIFYEGAEKPSDIPVTCEPFLEINAEEYFYFSISISEKEKIKGLKFHSTNSVAKEIGFPLLYDASVKVLNGPSVIASREDVKVKLPVFTFTTNAADTGISAGYATLEITDENNVPVNLNIPPAQLNDKEIDGAEAVPEFAFSVDASKLKEGIYEFKVGSLVKKFFLATRMEISNSVLLVRVLKNNFLEYKKDLADTTFVQFNLSIPKA